MDDVITLIKETVIGHDPHGNEIVEQQEREVFCQIYGITRSEFYSAAAAGLHPEITARLSDFEDYEGETTARHDGVLYSVIRAYRDSGSSGHRASRSIYQMPVNAVELILARRIGKTETAGEG